MTDNQLKACLDGFRHAVECLTEANAAVKRGFDERHDGCRWRWVVRMDVKNARYWKQRVSEWETKILENN